MLPPRVSEHNWWWCAWRSKTPQWPHWLSSARLPGSRTSFCALSWHSPHRPGGVQITGHWDWESNRDNLYRQDTGRCQGTQVMLCKWNMTSDTNSHVAAITGYRTGNPAKMLLQSVGWEANIISGGQGLIPAAPRSHKDVTRSLAEKNIMNGYLLLMQFEKLDMSSFISQS